MKLNFASILIAICFSTTLSGFAGSDRLLSVDTPFIDTNRILILDAFSYRPLDLQFNYPLGQGFAVSVNSSLPLFIVGLYNGGIKIGWDISDNPFAMSLSVRYMQFTGERLLTDLINQQLAGAATIVNADLNFTSVCFEGSFEFDLNSLRLYVIFDSQLLGNKNGLKTYLRPVFGADVTLDFVTFFAEAGYYIPMQPTGSVDSGSLIGLNTPGNLTAGGGIRFDLKAVIITGGVAYPGFELKYGTAATDVFSLPVLPYLSVEIPLL
jgi:hypothetical protein